MWPNGPLSRTNLPLSTDITPIIINQTICLDSCAVIFLHLNCLEKSKCINNNIIFSTHQCLLSVLCWTTEVQMAGTVYHDWQNTENISQDDTTSLISQHIYSWLKWDQILCSTGAHLSVRVLRVFLIPLSRLSRDSGNCQPVNLHELRQTNTHAGPDQSLVCLPGIPSEAICVPKAPYGRPSTGQQT